MKHCFYFILVCLIAIPLSLANAAQTTPMEGLVAEGEGHWQKAINLYLTILSKEPNRVDLWLRIADIEHHLGQDNLTILAYEQAIRAQPQNASLHKKLSEIYAGLNQPNNALPHIKEAVKLQPNNVEYIESLANIANWNHDSLLALQNYQKLSTLNVFINDKPKQIELLLNIAALQQALHQDKDALKTYEKIIQLAPDNLTAARWIKKYAPNQALVITERPKPLSPFEQYLHTANTEASAHHYALAIQALNQAIAIKKNQADLYKKRSEIYAMNNQPELALNSIHIALRYDPNNLRYLKAKGELASWAGQFDQALWAYNKLLQLKPYDENAMLNRAHLLATLGRTDEALIAYDALLSHYPNNALGWLYDAETLTWVERYVDAMKALSCYAKLKGRDINYLKTKARVYALTGYFNTSRAINEPILLKSPKDPYALTTEVFALKKGLQRKKALSFLKQLNRGAKDDEQVKNLNNILYTPLRSNLNANADYTWATDTTGIIDVPVRGEYFISPTTSILMQGLYERLTAGVHSGLEAVNGKGSIFDESARVGISTQVSGINLTALAGDLKIQQGSNFAIYDALLDTNLSEKLEITVESLHDLFRPYLVPQTPRSVSLEIMEQRTSALLQWQPSIQKYLYVLTSFSTLSDNNNYLHLNAWPKERVFGSQEWLINLGVDADIWTFARRANDGYFSPLFFQEYEGTIELYRSISENIGLSLGGGFGMQKDERLEHFFYAEDLNARLIYGIFNDYQIQLRGGYTLRVNPIKNYQCRFVSLAFTKRF